MIMFVTYFWHLELPAVLVFSYGRAWYCISAELCIKSFYAAHMSVCPVPTLNLIASDVIYCMSNSCTKNQG